jgi:two-component system, NarL family, sensor histidine kinase LiaS
MFKRYPLKFTGLFGKLILSYVLITLLAYAVSTIVYGLYDYSNLRGSTEPKIIAEEAKTRVEEVRPFFKPVNKEALKYWMKYTQLDVEIMLRQLAPIFFYNLESLETKEGFALITDEKGQIIASMNDINEVNYKQTEILTDTEKQLIESALTGERNIENLAKEVSDDTVLAVTPILDEQNNLIGTFLVRAEIPVGWQGAIFKFFNDIRRDILPTSLFVLFFSLVFSYPISRHLTWRLQQVSEAADAWRIGDFTKQARDIGTEEDEIGNLVRKLNSMALELQEVIALKQNLATSDERNRIARDLHDSVKQLAFGLSMQISATKNQLENGDENAKKTLAEAEKLSNMIQRELVALIQELRPLNEQQEVFSTRLKTYIQDWSRQNSIEISHDFSEIPMLTRSQEHTIFRITQEALSNIARHSEAEKTEIKFIKKDANSYQYKIYDNGKGFELSRKNKGYGLKNMRERTEDLKDGKFKCENKNGTMIEISFTV